ncbi:Putative membrane-bound redox modulator Alx [Candidatus Rhabdochlamydia oedothoracis]|uniref:Membrane-bound redox modulator Alx n=1 Tax=Candidatus Rhabdochlamydia oedothoracis TaxID=2720720 RepID=A0ABX8V0W4_9BACT|nr:MULTISPECIES: TerC/Alx family metal homeostasis membrane protein [Rhabdochlamydia]KAG6559148.1 Inner membrane protein alx [Candidatus Rhabdochlamydia sp. W815]MCL6755996.1 TerC/Alx family metal homeostasis membrane protein [Candidatus Rhabdochlamydia oedothoracis]QYF48868.1 Putative membrane-bound redox modulator Alx [Candidatus Rhabdochlamydia oedothoracis]
MGLSIWFWVAFHILIIGFLFLDLKVFHRNFRITDFKIAWIVTGFWILLALIFNLGIYFWQGSEVALQFFSGYLIEKSLSLDNLFVFLLIFQSFQIPKKQQQRVLFWGILGALFFRIGFILLGVKLVHSFDWVLYIFAVLLVFTAYKLLKQKTVFDIQHSSVLKALKKIFPLCKEKNVDFFILKEGDKWKITTLFLALLVIESSDILFAIDSIPAIFAITTDPFIIYTSNVFAILGLRSLYFAIYQSIERLHYLRFGLSAVLLFIALKIILSPIFPIPVSISLIITLLILSFTIMFPLFLKRKH